MTRKPQKLPPQHVLKEWFDYSAETGIFTWIKEPRKIGSVLGKVAGTVKRGYIFIKVPRFGIIGAHRLSWIYMHSLTIGGAEVDHIDCNPGNNAISNLRLATSSEQKQNKRVQSNNRSGLKGAFYHSCHKGKKWRSQIRVGPDLIFLGYFHTAQEAHDAYGTAAVKYFGEFSRVA